MTDIEMAMDTLPSTSGITSKPTTSTKKQNLPW